MLILHQLSYVLSILQCTFYAFSRTNLLTRCYSASSYFLLFLVSKILHTKYSRNWTGQKPEIIYLTCQHRRPRESRIRTPGRPHPPQAWPRAGSRLGLVRPTWAATDLASPPIYSTPRENPKSLKKFTKSSDAAVIVNPSSGGFLSSSRHSAGEGNHTGGNLHHHASLRGDA